MAYGTGGYVSPSGTGNPWGSYTGFVPSTIAQPQQMNTNNGGLMTIFVQSEEEVNNYPVAAGLTVLLISFGLKKFWLKSTDTSGVPQQPRSFSFNEETPLQNQNGAFVSRAEFSELSSKLDKLISELGGTKNE